MQPIDSLGEFWIPGGRDNALSGRLRYSPTDGIELLLVGDFEEADPNGRLPISRIFGFIEHRRVTLDNCGLRNSQFFGTGTSLTTYSASQLLVGEHLLTDQLEFTSVEVVLSYAQYWVGETGISVRTDFMGDQLGPVNYEAAYTPLPSEQVAFSRGTIGLRYDWKNGGEILDEVSVRQWPVFVLTYDSPRPLQEILADIRLLQVLATLSMDSVVYLDQLVLKHRDVKMLMMNGRHPQALQPVELLYEPIPYKDPEKRKTPHASDMLLTFQQLGGLNVVARWLDVSPDFLRPLNSLMSIKFAEHMYVENRFLNVTFAAEAFHRATKDEPHVDTAIFDGIRRALLDAVDEEHHEWVFGQLGFRNDPSLAKRLRRLAQRSGAATRSLTGDAGRWALTLSQTRNELTHLNPETPEFDGGDLHWLAESVYSVLRACMLLDAGVQPEVLEERAGSPGVYWFRPKLTAAIDRIRQQLPDKRGKNSPAAK